MNFLFWLLIKIFSLGGDGGDFDNGGDGGGLGRMKYVSCTKVKRACLELARIRQPIVEGVSELNQAQITKENNGFYTVSKLSKVEDLYLPSLLS